MKPKKLELSIGEGTFLLKQEIEYRWYGDLHESQKLSQWGPTHIPHKTMQQVLGALKFRNCTQRGSHKKRKFCIAMDGTIAKKRLNTSTCSSRLAPKRTLQSALKIEAHVRYVANCRNHNRAYFLLARQNAIKHDTIKPVFSQLESWDTRSLPTTDQPKLFTYLKNRNGLADCKLLQYFPCFASSSYSLCVIFRLFSLLVFTLPLASPPPMMLNGLNANDAIKTLA